MSERGTVEQVARSLHRVGCDGDGDLCRDCLELASSALNALGLEQVGVACFDGRHDGVHPANGRIGVVCSLNNVHAEHLIHEPVYRLTHSGGSS